MARRYSGEAFTQEFVLLFGFLSGLWIYAGVNPEAEIAKPFIEVINSLIPGTGAGLSFLYWIVSAILTIGSFWSSYTIGDKVGLIAVVLAFIGGIFIGSVGIWFLIAALIIGPYAVKRRRAR